VIFGVINMGDPEPETPETVAGRIRAALAHLSPERLKVRRSSAGS
jgi:methionine synthase II (cobalamin-independent)